MCKDNAGLIPLSLFECVRNNQAGEIDWPDFANEFQKSSNQTINSKEEAVLFCSTHFKNDRRAAKSAIHSGMIVLDIDNGATVGEAVSIFDAAKIKGLIYTTASHCEAHHKFRICVPLTDVISPNRYTSAWFWLNETFGGIADVSKKTCESMFYVSGHLPERTSEFHDFDGSIHTAEEWATLAPKQEVDVCNAEQKLKTEFKSKKIFQSKGRKRPLLEYDDVNGIDIYRNLIVPNRAIDKYLDRSALVRPIQIGPSGPPTNHHH